MKGLEDNEHWQSEIRSRYLTQEKYKKASPWLFYRKQGTWWRFCVRISTLPWVAIIVSIASCILTVFVVESILNSAANREKVPYVIVDNGTSTIVQIITVECETDVTVAECELRVKERAESSDFQRAMTETHLFCMVAVCWVGALIFFVTKAMRIRKRNRYLECLPHDSIMVWNTTVERASGKQTLPVQDYSAPVVDLVLDLPVHYEMERAIILGKFLHTYDPHCGKSADANWGSSTGKRKGTHFKTTLASMHALVDLATAFDLGLGLRRDQTARQYVDMLKRRFTSSQVSHSALDKVLSLYERAKFGCHPVGEDLFNEYGACMYELSMDFQRLHASPPAVPAPATESIAPPTFAAGDSTEEVDAEVDEDGEDNDEASVSSETTPRFQPQNPFSSRPGSF